MGLAARDWGFTLGAEGGLVVGGVPAGDLARDFGTPLHVLDERGLRERARGFRGAFEAAYPGPVSVHYALKCNSTPGVVEMVLGEGLLPEVGTVYEWELVRRLGAAPGDVIVNGPSKGPLLDRALEEGAGLLVVDGTEELRGLEETARARGITPRVLLRANLDCVPRGMNHATATASRKNSVFGFDVVSGELDRALDRLARPGPLHFAGLHCHVGTGIRHPRDYERPLERLLDCAAGAARRGLPVEVLDVGGGFGVPTSRELGTLEFLAYQALGRLPAPPRADGFPACADFAAVVGPAVAGGCRRRGLPLPRLVLEPGRAIVSSPGVLLISVRSIKDREGVGSWAVTDGGTGTVAFPLHYEYHEVILCSAPEAERTRRYDIIGPACFSADWVYRNKWMPPLAAGDVLAICDAGAYFTVQESNFGFPRPAIVAVRDGAARLLRRRETFEDMVERDVGWGNGHDR